MWEVSLFAEHEAFLQIFVGSLDGIGCKHGGNGALYIFFWTVLVLDDAQGKPSTFPPSSAEVTCLDAGFFPVHLNGLCDV